MPSLNNNFFRIQKHWSNDEIEYLNKYAKIKPQVEIATDLNRTKASVDHKMSRSKISGRKIGKDWIGRKKGSVGKKLIYCIDFFKTWSEDMAYIFGYWFADGCICKSNNRTFFQIVSTDLEILEKIKSAMKTDYAISRRKKKKSHWKTAYTFSIDNKEIYDDIKKLGGMERKSLIATFPYIPEKFISHFIRGYFDGDGSIAIGYRKNPHIGFWGTKKFLTILMKHLPCSAKINQDGNIYHISYSGKRSQSILKYMYENSKLFLKRKYELYKEGMIWEPKYGGENIV